MIFKEDARPLLMCMLGVGLIGAAAAETFGYPAPKWFITFALAYVGEWFIERSIRKGKGGE